MASLKTKLLAGATAALATLSLASLPAVADGSTDDDPLAGILDAIAGGGLDDIDDPAPSEPTEPSEDTPAQGDHRPGTDAHSVHVADDVTMTVDGKQVAHPCAGRDLLYHGHVDAAYVTRSGGKLAVMSVNGSEVKDPNSVCMRLAPEADRSGREVSRMVVPNDMFATIGSPGRIVWRAPQENIDNQWRPIWAGVGAFDPAHEWNVPRGEFMGNKVELKLADFSGPGDFEMFVNTSTNLYQIFSSRNARTATFDVGVHAHVNWTFTEAGIYELTWQARGVRLDGTVEESKPVKQYWLVGSDEQVGLPDGTTTGLNSITISAENQRDLMGLQEPENPYPLPPETLKQAPTLNGKTPDVKRYANAGVRIASSGEVYFDYRHEKGAQNLSGSVTKDGVKLADLQTPVIVEVPNSQIACVPPTDGVFGQWLSRTGNKWVWATPSVGSASAPSVSIDTRNFSFEDADGQGLSLDLPDLSGPASAGTMIGDPSGDKIRPLEVANSGNSRRIQVVQPGISRIRFVFSEPGLYEGSWVPLIKTSEGNVNAHHRFVFAVGNETINAIREANGISEKLPTTPVTECASTLETVEPGNYPAPYQPETSGEGEPTEPGGTQPTEPTEPGTDPSDPGTDPSTPGTDPTEPGEDPTDPATPDPDQPSNPEPVDTDPSQPVDPGTDPTDPNPTDPEVDPTAPSNPDEPGVVPDSAEVVALKKALQSAWAQQIPTHIVENGHMDLAGALRDSTLVTFLKDGADPANIVERPSGTFTFEVSDRARIPAERVPANVAALAPELAGGLWELPQIQNPRLPWLGFNTEAIDHSQLQPGTGTTISLENFEGPGRMILGHVGTATVEPTLDSANPSATINYPTGSHDHQFFWFSAPGVYSADFVYHWTDATGQQISVPLRVSFLVGEDAIALGRESVTTQTLPQIIEGAPEDPEDPGDNPNPSQPGEPGNPGADSNPGDTPNKPSEPGDDLTSREATPTDPGGDKPGQDDSTSGDQNPSAGDSDSTPAEGSDAAHSGGADSAQSPDSSGTSPDGALSSAQSSALASNALNAGGVVAGWLPNSSGALNAESAQPDAQSAQDANVTVGGEESNSAEAAASGDAQPRALSAPTPSRINSLLPGFLLGAGVMAAIGGILLLIASARKKS